MNNNMNLRATNALRILAVDAINKANSGHPGICLGAAPIIEILFTKFMRINPHDTNWINRDRFILSAGHGAPLLYSLMHLLGYNISIEDMKNLRQLNSITAGHPEYSHIPGIDASTGPLGQGIAMGVGMALSERFLRAKFNKEIKLIDNYIYVLCGDGDLQEGIAQEALSFLGHQQLNKYILLYDSNDIQLDGKTSLATSEKVKDKYEAMGFYYQLVTDGNDFEEIEKAISNARKSLKPSLIEFKTIIGYGSNVAGSEKSHGSPIGEVATVALRENLSWKEEAFNIPSDIYDYYKECVESNIINNYNPWIEGYNEYLTKYPELAQELHECLAGDFDFKYDVEYPELYKESSRKSSSLILDEISRQIPTFIGGSADLTRSTFVKGKDNDSSNDNPLGRNINFGVREHAMGAMINGMTLYGATKAFCGAFFVFSDYMKPAIRMAALMEIPSLFIFTHDSIAVGEDGPTHEPIEQLEGLRCIPNLNVIRPADMREVIAAYHLALTSKHTPTVIVLTRQNVITELTSTTKAMNGAYAIYNENEYDYTLLAVGSEVNLCLSVAKDYKDKKIRVISMPSEYIYEKNNNLFIERDKTIAVEMGTTRGWYKYAKYVYGIDTFGYSGKASDLLNKFGFTKDKLTEYLNKILK